MSSNNFSKASSKRFDSQQDLSNQLAYFSGLQDHAKFSGLDGKLVLIAEDFRATPQDDTNYVFGYVINQSLNMRLGRHIDLLPGEKIDTQLQFLQVMDGGLDELESTYFETEFLTLIMRNDNKVNLPVHKVAFGEFAAYTCETSEEAKTVAHMLKGKVADIIMIYSQVVIDRDDFVQLVWNNNVKLREATPDIVLNQSPFMREVLAFPTPEA